VRERASKKHTPTASKTQPPPLHPSSHFSTASVSFPTPAAATIAAAALAIDPELRPAAVSKAVWAEGADVKFRFAATDPRLLRAAACTFCDLGGVAARAVEAFPPLDNK